MLTDLQQEVNARTTDQLVARRTELEAAERRRPLGAHELAELHLIRTEQNCRAEAALVGCPAGRQIVG